MNEKYLCIYHHDCADGFGAAWVVRRKFGTDVLFYPGRYQTGLPSPEITQGRHVLLVDFSYRKAELEKLETQCETVTVLDHHATALKDLVEYTDEGYLGLVKTMDLSFDDFAKFCEEHRLPAIRALFDMNRSGAGLTWDYLFPDEKRPELINVLEDRDLWRFDKEPYKFLRPYTRTVQAAVFSYPYDFAVWDDMMLRWRLEDLSMDGIAIERKHFKDIAELVAKCQRMIKVGGHVVPAASLPYTLTSDAGHLMAKGTGTEEQPQYPFAVCYWDEPSGRVFSLRSAKGGADVGEVAKMYGGGGHRNAAGFRVMFEQLYPDGSLR